MESEKILQEHVKISPPEIKAFLVKKEWPLVTEQISKKNSFTEEQRTAFENEVLFVLLGMELASDFQKNLQERASVDASLANPIAEEISERVFKEVAQFLPTEIESEGLEQNNSKATVPEIAPEVHPASVLGETAHNTTPEEKKFMNMESQPTTNQKVPESRSMNQESGTIPQSQDKKPISYPDGKDPYREPIE